MHFSLVKILPANAPETCCCEDILLPLYHAFGRLGFTVEVLCNELNPNSVNILFGSGRHLARMREAIPAGSVFYALEAPAEADAPGGLTALARAAGATLWDYSARHVARYVELLGPGRAVQVRPGYVPEMARLDPAFPRSRDLLFYGRLSERRQRLLHPLSMARVSTDIRACLFGRDRDHAIARARLILNLHAQTPAALELPRLAYLWANRRPVLCETAPDSETFSGLEQACIYRACDDLLPAALGLLRDEPTLKRQAEQGFAAFSAVPQEVWLEAVVGRKSYRSALPLPDSLNAGSGADFRRDSLNVDINPLMNPDLVLDLSLPLDPDAVYPTRRFGEVRLAPDSFSRVTARDVLEHVSDLNRMMGNFLVLLREDGLLEISVPYDLSHGAWQDPTHVRAFNEMSWLYFCDWAWYRGWREWRFALESISYGLSEYGKSLLEAGTPMQQVIRTARAVGNLDVTLRKRRASEEEREEFDRLTRAYYAGAVGEWTVHEENTD